MSERSVQVDGDGREANRGAGQGLDAPRFNQLYDEAAPRVYGYLARRVGAEQAEDLTAEVFAQAWTSRDRYDPDRSDPVGWVFGIVMNLLRRHRRSAQRQLRAYGRLLPPTATADPADLVARRLDATEDLQATVRSLQQLSDLDRDLILLRAWAELSYQQISDATGVSVTVVRTRLNRARARLDGRTPEGSS